MICEEALTWPVAPTTSSCFVCGVLQSNAHALGVGRGCARGWGGQAVRCICRHAIRVGAAPPMRPDMIFGKDRLLDYCRPPRSDLFGKRTGPPPGRSRLGTSMPETASAATSLISRPLMLVAAAAGIVLAGTVALWAHYGTAGFYEMIVPRIPPRF